MSTSAGAAGRPARKPSRAGTNKGVGNPADRDGGTDSREQVVSREKEQFGGVKIGSAFFGWLAAAGTTVLLSAIATAFGAALLANNVDAAGEAAANPQGAGVAGVILLLVILFVAYFCGGYVAGRMARFNGVMQGVAVWVWGIVIAVVLAVIGAIASSELDINADRKSTRLNSSHWE